MTVEDDLLAISLDMPDLAEPWMASQPVDGGNVLRVTWLVHKDEMVDGGRVASHRGPCGHNAAHLILWHWCTGAVDMKAYGAAETAEFYPRWVPSMDPSDIVGWGAESSRLSVSAADGGPVRWRRCCGLTGRVLNGIWVPA